MCRLTCGLTYLHPSPPLKNTHSNGIEPGSYEAEWEATRGHGAPKPDPVQGVCHLDCLRAHLCTAIRATLKAEDLLSLCFRVEVHSVRESERLPPGFAGTPEDVRFEGFVRGPLAHALRQVEFPWWVYGELEIKPVKRRGMRTLPVPEGFGAAAAASAAAWAGGGGGLDTPNGQRRRTRQSPGSGSE